MTKFNREPVIKVGLMTGASSARITLAGRFVNDSGEEVDGGDYIVSIDEGVVALEGPTPFRSSSILLAPVDFDSCRITVHDITIGIDFHWQRKEAQQFQGSLRLNAGHGGLIVINELPLESYLVSVISSEMSASCPTELLRAHAIVSRSWLLAQLNNLSNEAGERDDRSSGAIDESSQQIIRWYDRENHADFDVCADDHCQRYQGISKAFSESAFDAIGSTRGKALIWNDEICDARYSKSCGGMTEVFRAAWEDRDVPYLTAIYDGRGRVEEYQMPLTDEANSEAWIRSQPPAYCNTDSAELLARILPGFDQETRDFYRWKIVYSQDELREIIAARLGFDMGRILALEPAERGESGRIIKLAIKAEKRNLVIGKELEIRRALSRSHLYSSAFVVETERGDASGYPQSFTLVGAGWGHGVGLCQIGAAVMADEGHSHESILTHYFRGATLDSLY
ncbi:MAG TPA: SpoIID/LytB domain-containing protein [Blastocatellia bacterium]|nr:SpoIID/LytB domain-containing protein [Blastocatellia bacterium]